MIPLLIVGIIVSMILLALETVEINFVIQTILLLVSMLLLFYASHPLAHYVVARIYGVRVKYFFVGKSDFGKLGGPFNPISRLLVTIGTKLDLDRAKTLSRKKRGFLFGSGAIVSTVLIAIPLIFAWFENLNSIALIFGSLFFILNLGSELAFSTKAGDLSKMKRELSRGT